MREEVIWEKSNISVRIYPPFKVLSSTKKVSYCVTLSWEVNELEVVVL